MAEDLVGDEEMADVRTREAPACRAVTFLVERSRIRPVLGALDVDPSIRRERGAVAAHARWRDAIEQVDAPAHAFYQILRKADAHQVARTIGRKRAVYHLEDAVHVRLGFSYRQATNAEPDPFAGVDDGFRCRDTQLVVNAALHDGEERLRAAAILAMQLLQRADASLEPANAPLTGVARGRVVALARNDVIELHDHVCAEVALDLHHRFRCEPVARSIDVAAELDAILVDRAERRK